MAIVDCYVTCLAKPGTCGGRGFPHAEEPATLSQVEVQRADFGVRSYILSQQSSLGFDDTHLLRTVAERPDDTRAVARSLRYAAAHAARVEDRRRPRCPSRRCTSGRQEPWLSAGHLGHHPASSIRLRVR